MLDSIDLVKKYGGKLALNHFTMSVEDGHIYGLLGPNGSGKSTWMKIAAGLIIPDQGQITLDGTRVGTETKRYIAYMPTEPFFYSYMKVRDIADYYGDFFDDFDGRRFEELIGKMNLNMQMKVRTLSSGMMAKLKIAVTLSRRARIYLLDEPLNGIDLLAREEIIQTILECADDHSAIVISSHLIEELEKIIDYAAFIKEGQIVFSGDVEGIRQQKGESVVDLYRNIYR